MSDLNHRLHQLADKLVRYADMQPAASIAPFVEAAAAAVIAARTPIPKVESIPVTGHAPASPGTLRVGILLAEGFFGAREYLKGFLPEGAVAVVSSKSIDPYPIVDLLLVEDGANESAVALWKNCLPPGAKALRLAPFTAR